jgi:hypothetical protein
VALTRPVLCGNGAGRMKDGRIVNARIYVEKKE